MLVVQSWLKSGSVRSSARSLQESCQDRLPASPQTPITSISTPEKAETTTPEEAEIPTVDHHTRRSGDPTPRKRRFPRPRKWRSPPSIATSEEAEIPTPEESEISTFAITAAEEADVPTSDELEISTPEEAKIPTPNEVEISFRHHSTRGGGYSRIRGSRDLHLRHHSSGEGWYPRFSRSGAPLPQSPHQRKQRSSPPSITKTKQNKKHARKRDFRLLSHQIKQRHPCSMTTTEKRRAPPSKITPEISTSDHHARKSVDPYCNSPYKRKQIFEIPNKSKTKS